MKNRYGFEVTVSVEDEGLQEVIGTLEDISIELEIEEEDDMILARGQLSELSLRYLDFLKSQTLDWQDAQVRIWETAA